MVEFQYMDIKPEKKLNLEHASDKETIEQIGQKYEAPTNAKSRVKKTVKIIFLLLIFAVSVYLLFTISDYIDDSGGISWEDLVKTRNIPQLLLVLAVTMLVIVALQTIKFCLISKTTYGKALPLLSLKINLLGKYYDNLTPSSMGGQPFQMYYYSKNGVDFGSSTAIPTVNYIVQMYTWQIATIVILALNGSYIYLANVVGAQAITIMCYVGWGLNMIIPVLLMFLVFVPKFATWLVVTVVKIGHKLHIIKNYDKGLKKGYKMLSDYQNALAIMIKRPWHCLLIAFVSLLEYLVMLSLPLLISNGMAGMTFNYENWLNTATLYVFSIYSIGFMPTPGGSGFAEVSSSLVFSALPGSITKWMVLFLRFCTYYLYIILGLGVSLVEIFHKKRIDRRQSKEAVLSGAEALFDKTAAVSLETDLLVTEISTAQDKFAKEKTTDDKE